MLKIEEIRNLKHREVILAVSVFLSTLAPGFLTIQSFYPDLVKELDVLKLIILSLSITLPSVAFNAMVFAISVEKPRWADVVLVATVSGFFVLYPALIFRLFLHVDLKAFAIIASAMQAFSALFTRHLAKDLEKTRSSQPQDEPELS